MQKLKSVKTLITQSVNGQLGKYAPSIAALASNWVNGALREEIEDAFAELKINEDKLIVNVQLPFINPDQYAFFVKECAKILKPLGYDCELSHDGGGMYNTLFVTAKLPKRRVVIEL